MQKCARCRKLRPVGEYEGCFITCKACRIEDYSKGGIRFIFFDRGRYRKPLHLPDYWNGYWDNINRLQEDIIGELP